LPVSDPCRFDVCKGLVRTLGAGSGLLVGQVRRHVRERAVLGNRHVLGMRTERSFVISEYLVADCVSRDATADRFNYTCELVPQNRGPWPAEASEEFHEEGLGRPARAVRAVHCRRMNLDEYLVVPDVGFSISAIRTTSGGPYLVCTAALIRGL
jgi:hypothetical protein